MGPQVLFCQNFSFDWSLEYLLFFLRTEKCGIEKQTEAFQLKEKYA
jgi:hypothetical protein